MNEKNEKKFPTLSDKNANQMFQNKVRMLKDVLRCEIESFT